LSSPPSAFAIVAHPDDIEFMMAGTLMQLGEAGFDLHYMTVANGSCGSVTTDAPTTAAIRGAEAQAAAAMIGATYHEPICNDLEIFYDAPTLRKLTAIIRTVAPTLILTHPPVDYMEDHMNTCRLVLTAAFARGAPNFATDPPSAAIDQEITIYHALPYGLHDPLNRPVVAEFYVDITGVIDRKAAMLALHESQQAWLEASQGVGAFTEQMRAMSRAVGRLSGRYQYAEGWTRHLPTGYCAPDADPLRKALSSRWTDHASL
jgi:LmbE family N-acetylglucosaminyl deacetylase